MTRRIGWLLLFLPVTLVFALQLSDLRSSRDQVLVQAPEVALWEASSMRWSRGAPFPLKIGGIVREGVLADGRPGLVVTRAWGPVPLREMTAGAWVTMLKDAVLLWRPHDPRHWRAFALDARLRWVAVDAAAVPSSDTLAPGGPWPAGARVEPRPLEDGRVLVLAFPEADATPTYTWHLYAGGQWRTLPSTPSPFSLVNRQRPWAAALSETQILVTDTFRAMLLDTTTHTWRELPVPAFVERGNLRALRGLGQGRALLFPSVLFDLRADPLWRVLPGIAAHQGGQPALLALGGGRVMRVSPWGLHEEGTVCISAVRLRVLIPLALVWSLLLWVGFRARRPRHRATHPESPEPR